MNGNTKWFLLAVATAIGFVGTMLKLDRDRIESTALKAEALAAANATQIAVANARLAEIQATLIDIRRDLREHMKE